MIVKEQKPIEFVNPLKVKFESDILAPAIKWYSQYFFGKPCARLKKIFLHGKYPAVSIHGIKVHIHRLVYFYDHKRGFFRDQYIHHKDGNKMNAEIENLELMTASEHQSITNKGRKQTPEWIKKRITKTANTKRGKKYPKVYENGDLLK